MIKARTKRSHWTNHMIQNLNINTLHVLIYANSNPNSNFIVCCMMKPIRKREDCSVHAIARYRTTVIFDIISDTQVSEAQMHLSSVPFSFFHLALTYFSYGYANPNCSSITMPKEKVNVYRPAGIHTRAWLL